MWPVSGIIILLSGTGIICQLIKNIKFYLQGESPVTDLISMS